MRFVRYERGCAVPVRSRDLAKPDNVADSGFVSVVLAKRIERAGQAEPGSPGRVLRLLPGAAAANTIELHPGVMVGAFAYRDDGYEATGLSSLACARSRLDYANAASCSDKKTARFERSPRSCCTRFSTRERHHLDRWTTKDPQLQVSLKSPLTESNRRPSYHRATRREPRARPGSRGHESRARRRKRPKPSDHAMPRRWPRWCSLIVPFWPRKRRAQRGGCSLSRLLVWAFGRPRPRVPAPTRSRRSTTRRRGSCANVREAWHG